MILTGGEAYLTTPEDELSFVVRSSLDVYAVVATCCVIAFAIKAALQPLYRRCGCNLKARLADGSLSGPQVMPKAKGS